MTFWAAGIAAAGTVVGGALSANAAGDAADTQSDAANRAAGLSASAQKQLRSDLQPYTQAGESALSRLMGNYGDNPGDWQNFLISPDYQFARDEGLRGIENRAAGRGMLLSGRHLKDLNRFNSGLASQQYGNWFNRLYNLANMGQNSAAQVGSQGASAATSQGNALLNAGNAQASGYINQANSYNNALSGLVNLGGQYAQNRSGYNQRANNAGTDLDYTMSNSNLW